MSVSRYSIAFAGGVALLALLLWSSQQSNEVLYSASVDGIALVASERELIVEDALEVKIAAGQYERRVQIRYQLQGDALLFVNASLIKFPRCVRDSDWQRCAITVVTVPGQNAFSLVRKSGSEALRVHIEPTRVLKQRNRTTLDSWGPAIPLLAIALLLPLVWLTHRSLVGSQWIILCCTAVTLSWLQPLFTAILIAYLVAAYQLGTKAPPRISLLWLGVGTSIAVLVLFKYGYSAVTGIFADPGRFGLMMPLGLSYFLIRHIDTQFCWYRRRYQDVSLREYLCFVLFPATLPAGPIATLDHFRSGRLDRIRSEDVLSGLGRALFGVVKKFAVADPLLFEPLFAQGGLMEQMALSDGLVDDPRIVWLLLGSFLFVYLDFSAYSDIAIGLSRALGYRVPENFNLPVFARNVRDYWRRWHMSLSGWCMRNIYVPLLLKTRSAYLGPYAVMLVVGLWHSLTLSWLAWAIHHGSGIAWMNVIGQSRARGEQKSSILEGVKHGAGIIMTVTFVGAGHAFAQIHDFELAARFYASYWLSLPSAAIDLVQQIMGVVS